MIVNDHWGSHFFLLHKCGFTTDLCRNAVRIPMRFSAVGFWACWFEWAEIAFDYTKSIACITFYKITAPQYHVDGYRKTHCNWDGIQNLLTPAEDSIPSAGNADGTRVSHTVFLCEQSLKEKKWIFVFAYIYFSFYLYIKLTLYSAPLHQVSQSGCPLKFPPTSSVPIRVPPIYQSPSGFPLTSNVPIRVPFISVFPISLL